MDLVNEFIASSRSHKYGFETRVKYSKYNEAIKAKDVAQLALGIPIEFDYNIVESKDMIVVSVSDRECHIYTEDTDNHKKHDIVCYRNGKMIAVKNMSEIYQYLI